jgi:hypothetical protein
MPIPAGVYHVVFGGDRIGGEVWESGFLVQGGVPASNDAANALALLWWGQLTSTDGSGALVAVAANLWAASTTVRYVKVYCYPAGGPTAEYIGEHIDTPLVGSQALQCPNQVALVISLRTNFAGRAHRGRMYLPMDNLSNDGHGQQSSANVNQQATKWALCFHDWNASGDNGIVSVVSRIGAGGALPVTSIVVDSRADIQRRRANKQAALYTGVGTP